MKMKTMALIVVSMFLMSCAGPASKTNEVKQESMVSEAEAHTHDAETEGLVLNNGEKWKVDEHMMVFIQDMENDVQTIALSQEKDYNLLAGELQENVKLLTSNCTMSGMAHDELHKWLVPFITEVNELSEAGTDVAAGEVFLHIQQSFIVFNQYFQ